MMHIKQTHGDLTEREFKQMFLQQWNHDVDERISVVGLRSFYKRDAWPRHGEGGIDCPVFPDPSILLADGECKYREAVNAIDYAVRTFPDVGDLDMCVMATSTEVAHRILVTDFNAKRSQHLTGHYWVRGKLMRLIGFNHEMRGLSRGGVLFVLDSWEFEDHELGDIQDMARSREFQVIKI